MRLSDYIVSFLIEKGITDVFGYPGGMVTHLMDSLEMYKSEITAHVNYNEQGSSFCACGYAQATQKPGVAYATSGPGATNMVTGIANAFFDSLPCIFITGQVNTYESKGSLSVRQKGFQETNIVDIVLPITKYAVTITDEKSIKSELEKAFFISMSGRPGPVVLDIPMNIFRAEIEPTQLVGWKFQEVRKYDFEKEIELIKKELSKSKKPVILAGHGIEGCGMTKEFRALVEKLGVPVVTSMIAKDVLTDSEDNFGFIGAYGNRWANFIISNSDLILSIGSRIDCRQTGNNLGVFAENARLIRIDIDKGEVSNQIKTDEMCIIADIAELIPKLNACISIGNNEFKVWSGVCKSIKERLETIDQSYELEFVERFSDIVADDTIITTDVGQNQVWVAQAFRLKRNQKMFFSGGHGAMGYSLPAAIGACIGSGKKVISFSGDGGFQMNMQELQFIVRESLPIKIVVMNNHSLGMIRHFQEMYFESRFVQTTKEYGYTNPDFEKIAQAYGLVYIKISNIEEIGGYQEILNNNQPCFVEVDLSDTTYVMPKLAMGKPIHDQEPSLDRELFKSLMEMCEL